MGSRCYILEGSWWKAHELPQVLPYFQALAATESTIGLAHRTIRSLDDIAYWVKKIPKNSRSFLYFACHGEELDLLPGGRRSRVCRQDLLEVLSEAKEGAIAFLHFGCCEMVDPHHRRQSLRDLADASGAYWVSGYTSSVDWLRSMFLDLALLAEVYLTFATAAGPSSGGRRSVLYATMNSSRVPSASAGCHGEWWRKTPSFRSACISLPEEADQAA